MRVKSRWNKSGKSHTVEEVAGALASIAWKIAGNAVLELENDNFQTETQLQRLTVIAEFLAFLVHVTDRLCAERMDEEERRHFVTALALRVTDLVEENLTETTGPGEYRGPFIDRLNQRMAEYAEFSFSAEEGPGFGLRRVFGEYVSEAMGPRDRRWIQDHVIDLYAPEAVTTLRRAMNNLSG